MALVEQVLVLENEQATLALGAALGRVLGPGSVVLMSGGLGAGKTVLAKGMAQGLEVDASYGIVSPTFTLLNIYPGRVAFFHADLYRLDESQVADLDLLEEAASGVLAVEWAERGEGLWPTGSLRVELELIDESQRRATLKGESELLAKVRQQFNSLPQEA